MGNWLTSEAFNAEEKLVLEYADAVTRTPVDVSEELFQRLRARWNEPQLVELTSALAWENYRARFAHAGGIEAQGFSQGAFCPTPVHGAAKPSPDARV